MKHSTVLDTLSLTTSDGSDGSSTGAIVGGVVAAALLMLLIVVFVVVCLIRSVQPKPAVWKMISLQSTSVRLARNFLFNTVKISCRQLFLVLSFPLQDKMNNETKNP